MSHVGDRRTTQTDKDDLHPLKIWIETLTSQLLNNKQGRNFNNNHDDV